MSTVNTIDKYMTSATPSDVPTDEPSSLTTSDVTADARDHSSDGESSSSKRNRSSGSTDSPSAPSAKRTVYDGDENVFSIPEDAPFWVPMLFKSMDNVSRKVSDLASLFEDYKTHVEAKITKFKDETDTKIADLEGKISTIIDEKAAMAATISDLEGRCKQMSFHFSNTLHLVDASLDAQEQYSRRNCALLHGVKEEKNENTDDVIVAVISKQLGVKVEKSDIDRSHRLGAPRSDGKHRPIIIKFARYNVRASVFRAKRNFKNTGMLLTDSLTRRRIGILSEARAKYGMRNVWTTDGEVFTKIENKNVNITKGPPAPHVSPQS